MKKRISATIEESTERLLDFLMKKGIYRNKSHIIEDAIKLLAEVKNNKGKKAQVAVWVIIAMVIAAVILMLFFFNKSPITTNQGGAYDLQSVIDKCVRDSGSTAIERMLPQGGFLEPANYKIYKNINVTYLCQNIGYYRPCISQHPLLLNDEISEINNYTKPIIEQCFLAAQTELQKRNYELSMDQTKLNISLGPGKVYFYITKHITITKNGQTQKFDKFDVALQNPIYDLSKVAMEITGQEAKYCYFEYVGYMLLYPRWDIRKFTFSDSTKIYTIEDKQSKKEMNIAIRGCAIPPGI